MSCTDKNDQERGALLTFVGFIDKEVKGMWIYRSSSYVAKGNIFPGNGDAADLSVARVGRSRTSYT